MKHLLWITPISFVLLILILFVFIARLKITLNLEDGVFKVYVYRFKILDTSKKSDKNVIKPLDKEQEFEKKYKGFKYVVNAIRRILDDKNDDVLGILRHIRRTFGMKRLDVSIDYGTGDAAVTGITSGALWALISSVSAYVGRYINIKNILNIAVKLNYTERVLNYKINFVFTARVYHLLKTVKLVLRFTKTLKGVTDYGTV